MVAADTEGARSRTCQNDHADGPVVPGAVQRGYELIASMPTKCVQLAWRLMVIHSKPLRRSYNGSSNSIGYSSW
ncbi:hypothetical protein [Xanthomonas hortorum]|uniref:hypothetical protein n=1 Tax=Xanthomonas hortorum TaxID=56454 RepID=UPI0029358047|nr:hypothetical protein [Xanthomonas hortorum]MDV2452749.1 hypothetical protein [Xanthomonas hortorum NBC5720]